MTLHHVKHPLIDDVLSELRDTSTPPQRFRPLASRVTTLLAYDASRDLPGRTERVRTPLEETDVQKLDASVVLVPVLRAGMGMLEVMLSVFPSASVGYVGLERDESTAVARQYYRKLPDLSGRFVFLLDPMLAWLGQRRGVFVEGVRCGERSSFVYRCRSRRDRPAVPGLPRGRYLHRGGRPRPRRAQIYRPWAG